jgi:hypothetical protein
MKWVKPATTSGNILQELSVKILRIFSRSRYPYGELRANLTAAENVQIYGRVRRWLVSMVPRGIVGHRKQRPAAAQVRSV